MSIPRALIDCLNTNKIPYEILPHAVAFTARTSAATEHIASHHQAKVVMVGSGSLSYDRRHSISIA